MSIFDSIKLHIALWCLKSFFPTVVIYNKGKNDDIVEVIHFAKNEEILTQSMVDFLKDALNT